MAASNEGPDQAAKKFFVTTIIGFVAFAALTYIVIYY